MGTRFQEKTPNFAKRSGRDRRKKNQFVVSERRQGVRRAVDTKDRRAKLVFLTDAAQAPMQVMREVAAGVREDALLGLSAADQDRFVDALLTIKSNLMGPVNGASKGNGQSGC